MSVNLEKFTSFSKLTQLIFFIDASCQDTLPAALEAVLERTQDFTDSAYTSHEHREAILEASERLKSELDHLLGLYANVVCFFWGGRNNVLILFCTSKNNTIPKLFNCFTIIETQDK